MQNTTKSQAGSRQEERTDSMVAVSASKLATADLNNLMRALEIDVVALTEMLIPSGYRAEMGTIDAPAIHYTISGRGRISIGNGPWMSLERLADDDLPCCRRSCEVRGFTPAKRIRQPRDGCRRDRGPDTGPDCDPHPSRSAVPSDGHDFSSTDRVDINGLSACKEGHSVRIQPVDESMFVRTGVVAESLCPLRLWPPH